MKNIKQKQIVKTFRCLRCGNCCRGKSHVYLSWKEIQRIADFVQISFIDFRLQYLATLNNQSVLKSQKNGDCIFLKNGDCIVHPVKPDQCRRWPFWQELIENREQFSSCNF